MAIDAVPRTWSDFWGDLLFRRCHAGNLAWWSAREARAALLTEAGRMAPGARLLDLGCGDGILDICLARRGLSVRAVDRIGCLIEAARRDAGDAMVRFEVADLRTLRYPPGSFDAVLMFEMLGLMSRADDQALIARAADWLAAGGHLFADGVMEPEAREGHDRQILPDGELELTWTFDPETRLQHIEPVFHAATGERIVLHDPYDLTHPDQLGVVRYLYPKDELVGILRAHFTVRELPAEWRPGKYLLIADAA